MHDEMTKNSGSTGILLAGGLDSASRVPPADLPCWSTADTHQRRDAMPKAEESTVAERVPLLPETDASTEAPAPEQMEKPVARTDATAPTAALGREDFFDNAKGMTVLVVIFSHTCMTYINLFDVAVLRACFLMGSLVAMPAFSFLSGHLSSATLTPRRQVGIAKMLLIFIIYQILYFLAGQGFSWARHDQPGVHAGMGAHKQPGLPLPVWGINFMHFITQKPHFLNT